MAPTRQFLLLFGALAASAITLSADGATQGIPISHAATLRACGGCHQPDSNGMMRRISYIRTTPEVWQQIIKRMVRLNGLKITPEETREVVKYLSANNGLSPEETKPVFYEAEHRSLRHQDDGVPQALLGTCNYCHTIGRVLSQRRTKDDYDKLATLHVALFPGSETAVFRPRRPAANPEDVPFASNAVGGGMPFVERPNLDRPTRGHYPIEDAIDWMTANQPLLTPEWTSWRAAMKAPKLAGKWMVNGYQTGKGKIYGEVTVEATGVEDEFTTKMELFFPANATKMSRTGKAIVYTGFSWRGRSKLVSPAADSRDPGNTPAEEREALMLSRDGNTLAGRWFWGGYDEFGIDVTLTRVGAQPLLAGTDKFSLQTGASTDVTLYGANFPADLKVADLDLGTGVKVKKLTRTSAMLATAQVEVASAAPVGMRDVSLRGASAIQALSVYDKIASIKILPDASMARLGGKIAPKQFQQYEAVGYTAGNVPIGPVQAAWSLEEFLSTPDDDDVKYVGVLNDSGLFTPAGEGPNPARKKQSNNFPTNNWGDVWVNASYRPPGGEELKARAYLVVTIPMYVRYDQPEVSQ